MDQATHDPNSEKNSQIETHAQARGNGGWLNAITRRLLQIGPFAPLAAWATVGPVLGGALLAAFSDQYGPLLRDHEMLGLVGFVIIGTLLAAIAAAPTLGLSIVAGWAFGAEVGIAAMLLVVNAAALLGWFGARVLAGPGLSGFLLEHPRLVRVRHGLFGSGFSRTTAFIAAARLPPQIPFGLFNLLAGSVRASLGPFAVGTAIGMLPRVAFVTWSAATVTRIDFQAPDTWFLTALAIAGFGVVVLMIGRVAWQAMAR